MRRFVVVSGLPGSGKTTLARRLGTALDLPVIDKDEILERLFEARGARDPETRRALSRESDEVFRAEAMASAGAILVSFWHVPGMPPDSGTPTDWLADLSDRVVNVACVCPVVESLEPFVPSGPIPGLPRLSIDTRSEPDLDALLERIANTPEGEPACSFCGARPPAELIRAGGRPFFICAECVESPRVDESTEVGMLCTFCEQAISCGKTPHARPLRAVAVARRGLRLCRECLQVSVQILAEDRAVGLAGDRQRSSRD